MRIIKIQDISSAIESVRPRISSSQQKKVLAIISDVKKRKDRAVKEYEKKFSNTSLRSLRVSPKEFASAYSEVTNDQVSAIKIAKSRLEKSERMVKNQFKNTSISFDGAKIQKLFTPINSVGCYIPGGKARYPSTVVMSVIPAKVAGVKRIAATSPPDEKGEIDPLTLVAADICGVDEFYKMGGAQAIAALAYGTESISQVDKIVGPGGIFVTIAKSLLSDVVSIDMVAGPTELAILADSYANPKLVALDLISQAEHSVDTMCCLITNSTKLASSVIEYLKLEVRITKRSDIVKESLEKNGFIAICKTEKDMADFANSLAPEHLEIMTANPDRLSKKITNAGLLLLGQNTPSSASDYLLGSNHILPTNRFGRTRGSLGVLDYVKLQTSVTSTKKSLSKISKYMKAFTDAEGLPNHYNAVKGRL